MKYTIEAIENAKPGMRWEEIGCQWTLGQAYLYSKEAGNDLPNFAEVIWDSRKRPAEFRRSHLGLRHRSDPCRLPEARSEGIHHQLHLLKPYRDHCKV